MNKSERFFVVACAIIFLGFIYGFLGCIDLLDQYESNAVVVSVERLDKQVVTFETEDGDLFVEYFDYENTIEPQSKAVLTIKEYEDTNAENDEVVKIKWVE